MRRLPRLIITLAARTVYVNGLVITAFSADDRHAWEQWWRTNAPRAVVEIKR